MRGVGEHEIHPFLELPPVEQHRSLYLCCIMIIDQVISAVLPGS